MQQTPPPKRKPPSSPIESATIRGVRWLPARPQSPAGAPEEKVNTQPAPRRMR
jgi:hypothetical protein